MRAACVQLGEGFNGADLRNVCTEAGMFAIRDERDYVVHEDFMKVSGPVQCTVAFPQASSALHHLLLLHSKFMKYFIATVHGPHQPHLSLCE